MKLLYDTHMHTPLCNHAVGEPEEYAAAALAKGFKGIIFTCHNPAPAGWAERGRMTLAEFPRYLEMVDRARRAFEGRLDVRVGLESDYIPGFEKWLEELHARAPLHYVLGSVHPHLGEYKALFFKGDPQSFFQIYFEHLAQAAESKLFDCLAHPDLVKNTHPAAWSVEQMLPTICAALDRIAQTGVAMELNTSGLNKEIKEMNPGNEILREIAARRIPVVIGSDSHKPERVGENFALALSHLQEAGFQSVNYFIERKRIEVPIADLQ